ncbi:hypothetical protein BDB00DRAFT_932686 [Zychaea mexicana]|uniref:uncharacterized protein n=1 Tax=Zychaea mexicana TaxID=64656 RepID=UPI0022FF34CF|nr:uncharacterized protein BDB00DRAFT_932686 [Zychaea mexicana]KAI9488485.1 hypothetical protein BDB00DRAFT_932686 [Zychaea mexicana]
MLDGQLPRRYLENWLTFVDACHLLVKPSITVDDIAEANKLLQQFCTGAERLITKTTNAIIFAHPQNRNHGATKDFWQLETSIAQAAKDGTDPVSVEEKVMDFALSCNYYHPSQPLILDVSDKNWINVFTEAELLEIKNKGGALECTLPGHQTSTTKVKTSAEVFKYARSIIINDPLTEPLEVWFSAELQNVARLFFKTHSFDIYNMPETDQQYLAFGFFATVFQGSNIVPKGTETSSEANANAVNSSRQLSSVTAISNRKMGRRGDTIFKYGSFELGCSESRALILLSARASGQLAISSRNAGITTEDPASRERFLGRQQEPASASAAPFVSASLPVSASAFLPAPAPAQSKVVAARDQTKASRDCSMKMPLVLRDMLLYSITGGSTSLLDVNIPAGFVTRVRKTEPLRFPHTDSNLVSRLLPLMTLAYSGKKILDKTVDLLDDVPEAITMSSNGAHWCLPPNLTVPSPSSSSWSLPSKRLRLS